MVAYRQVRVREDTALVLQKMKIIPRESFDSVLVRLFKKAGMKK
jgi:hypothetical protein